MRIAQAVLPNASIYERKSQRIDFATLSERHEVVLTPLEAIAGTGADVAHVYASEELPGEPFVRFPVPYVASMGLRPTRWSLRKPVEPEFIATPFEVPEAVDDIYFEPLSPQPFAEARPKVIGSLARPSIRGIVEQTLHRVQRSRDDVEWHLFDHPIAPVDLTGVDIWVDPTVAETDFDGFVAEALVAGMPVVATRTAINLHRLEKGRTGLLVPPGDPNELCHAILSALFKPEVASNKVAAARQTLSKFKARQRLRVLIHMYETLVR